MPPKRITLLTTWVDTVTIATNEHMDSGTKNTLAGLNYHLLGGQKIPRFLETIVCLNLNAL